MVLALSRHHAAVADDATLAGGHVTREIAVMRMRSGCGISILTFLPQAAALKEEIVPVSSMTIIASGTVSRIERRCASLAARSSCALFISITSLLV